MFSSLELRQLYPVHALNHHTLDLVFTDLRYVEICDSDEDLVFKCDKNHVVKSFNFVLNSNQSSTFRQPYRHFFGGNYICINSSLAKTDYKDMDFNGF